MAGWANHDETLQELATSLALAERPAVVLTGAGISADSGIPTFQGDGGLWTRYDPAEYADIAAFQRDPERVWAMLRELDATMAAARPNPAHRAVAELEQLGVVRAVITQNVDGLHQAAGSRYVLELHGTYKTLTCPSCANQYRRERVLDGIRHDVPRCLVCSAVLKPDVVFFGEPIPRRTLLGAWAETQRCSHLLVIGTAAAVEPAASLPELAARSGARIVEFNPRPVLPGATAVPLPAADPLPMLVEMVREAAGPQRFRGFC